MVKGTVYSTSILILWAIIHIKWTTMWAKFLIATCWKRLTTMSVQIISREKWLSLRWVLMNSTLLMSKFLVEDFQILTSKNSHRTNCLRILTLRFLPRPLRLKKENFFVTGATILSNYSVKMFQVGIDAIITKTSMRWRLIWISLPRKGI